MDQQATAIIAPDGSVRGVYSDLVPYHAIGMAEIVRASHVEPDEYGMWWADLSPVQGPKLGPYLERTKAVQSEMQWLELHWLNKDGSR
jgi:hypothetical protein